MVYIEQKKASQSANSVLGGALYMNRSAEILVLRIFHVSIETSNRRGCINKGTNQKNCAMIRFSIVCSAMNEIVAIKGRY